MRGKLPYKILSLFVLLIVPLNILSIYISAVTIRDARSQVMSSIQSTLGNYTQAIDQTIYNSEFLLYYLSHNSADGVRFFTSEESLEYQMSKLAVSTYVIDQSSNNKIADTLYFYRQDTDDITLVSGDTAFWREYLSAHDYFPAASIKDASWYLDATDSGNYLVRNMTDGSMLYGAIIELDEQTNGIDRYLDTPILDISFSDVEPKDENSYTSASVGCSRASLYLTVTFRQSVLTYSISMGRYLVIGIAILYIVLIPLLYWFIRKWVIWPISTLNTAHQELAQGKEDYRIAQTASSLEMTDAFRSFNHMADNLQTLRLENVNKELANQALRLENISRELKYKELLLDNLQLQIRPHFLLNAFNLLFTMVKTGKSDAAQKMILFLSQYFRYLFQYEKDLEIFPREFELIQNYLDVSRFQYPDGFTFQYSFDPEISLVRVPPLLLHNFVDNILQHALIHGQTVHIMFTGSYEDGIVTFELADDGRGISPEDVAQINSGNYDDYQRGRHVGLRNSIKRLKYFYHDTGTIHVKSTPGEGTVFIITFPYNLEENE